MWPGFRLGVSLTKIVKVMTSWSLFIVFHFALISPVERSAPRFHLAELGKDQQSKVKLTSSNTSADSDQSMSLVRARWTSWPAKTHSLSVVLINRKKFSFQSALSGRKRSCSDLFSQSGSTNTIGCTTTSRRTLSCATFVRVLTRKASFSLPLRILRSFPSVSKTGRTPWTRSDKTRSE